MNDTLQFVPNTQGLLALRRKPATDFIIREPAGWWIIHVPTGRAMATVRLKADAIRIAQRAFGKLGIRTWRSSNVERVGQQFRKRLLDWLRAEVKSAKG